MSRPEKIVFGENGRVMNPPPQNAPTLKSQVIDAGTPLIRRRPERLWQSAGWLAAGPLNPVLLLFTVPFGLSGAKFEALAIHLLAGIGVGYGLWRNRKRKTTLMAQVMTEALVISFCSSVLCVAIVLGNVGLSGGAGIEVLPIYMFGGLLLALFLFPFATFPATVAGLLLLRIFTLERSKRPDQQQSR